jgi:alpha-ketoglutarate-dependent 2,4-dichlorophenoxyacetate dioxygenase
MSISIHSIDPAHPEFVGEVEGIDLHEPASPAAVAAIEAGMDRFAILVFHDQHIEDEQQVAFTRNLGPIDPADGDIARPHERRLSMEVNDISNLDREGRVLAREDRRRLFGLGKASKGRHPARVRAQLSGRLGPPEHEFAENGHFLP